MHLLLSLACRFPIPAGPHSWRSRWPCCLLPPLRLRPRRKDISRKPFQVSGAVNLEVQTRSGDIVVRSGASGSVSIRAKIYVGDHWLFGNRQTEVSDIEQHPPAETGREQHPHRQPKRTQHFDGLRNHRTRRHHYPQPQRLGKPDVEGIHVATSIWRLDRET